MIIYSIITALLFNFSSFDLAEVNGTVPGALKAVHESRRKHKPVVYYSSWREALPHIQEKADTYEGMMLNTTEDFMKNEPIIIIVDSVIKQKSGSYRITEEVIYPVWSTRNDRHVLRSAKISFLTKGKTYVGLDGKTHKIGNL